MSLNVVIVAVIAIVILVVLIVIFTGKTRFFGKVTGTCEAKGGQCFKECPEGYVTQLGSDCKEISAEKPICCTPFGAVAKAPTPEPEPDKKAGTDS